MNFHVLTLFPEMIRDGFETSITGRAVEKGLLSLETVNIRDFSVNKHNRVDDTPYGGGKGMLLWQGVAAFKLYTGKDMPVEEVKERFFS